jgi:gamma-glutamyl-gamma-aminobutyrate hydrolase PuuD
MRPLIGIPPRLAPEGRQQLDRRYADAVADAGGAAVLLPVQRDVRSLLRRVDGVLVPGGGDFAPPAPYPADVPFDRVLPEQLDFDTRLLDAALEAGRPVLGICYGMQLLALRHGARLHFHIPRDVPEAGEHQLPEPDGRHGLALQPGSRLAALLDGVGPSVNSRHHQALASAGTGLRVAARAEDGVIESVEGDGSAFCLGVQWHPERLPGPHRDRLFAAFVAAAAGGAGAGRQDAEE